MGDYRRGRERERENRGKGATMEGRLRKHRGVENKGKKGSLWRRENKKKRETIGVREITEGREREIWWKGESVVWR